MPSTSQSITATCQCGAAQHNVTMPDTSSPVPAVFCHCDSCRHMSGCLSVTSIALPPNVPPQTGLLDRLTPFEFSKNRITHYFCSICGTHMVARVLPRQGRKDFEELWFFMCGTIQNMLLAYQPCHEFIADTIDGGIAKFLSFDNGRQIERWAQRPEDGQHLPLDWSSHTGQATPSPPDGTLHAHCKCRGVEFWITRLSTPSKYAATICDCESCRLSSGMDSRVVGLAQIPIQNMSLDREGCTPCPENFSFGTIKKYQHVSGEERAFCATCGASIFVDRHGLGTLRIAVGLFVSSKGARAEDWLEWKGIAQVG
ncbi:hypothetical protein PFICI_08865 [Pestalotiopsis fici W106-1]|uniref:CENP-V/GFA domain-containing protein n=1 Tax=Pestalotiopsis fici (strain W106-1 / CGMCC3.15140) TaxID=1229662 RepID=W3X0U7_PESFW|nr:uncharacterized protein PFICI_08865 [Pestalotiopsis fici W106-1]ETS79012.1 hypothetical protein PFICI_08865 [Pestalotiopsis fici W106-1]